MTGSSSPTVGVTVIVPTYARPDRLAACLDGLARLEPPPGGFEVVIVDDGSPEALDQVVDAHRGGLDLRLHRQANTGPARARNVGAELARGDLLAFTDDDCVPEPGWLRALARAHQEHPDALLGGATRNAVAGDPYAEASQLLIDHVCGYDGNQPAFFPSNNIAVPAARFAALGGFDEHFPRAAGEDRDLCRRWLEAGHPLVRVPEAVVDHHHAFTMRRFWRQHHNYGRGAHRFHRARSARSGGGLGVEPVSFYLGLVGRPFGRAPLLRALQLSVLLGVSQVANAAGYAVELASQAATDRRATTAATPGRN